MNSVIAPAGNEISLAELKTALDKVDNYHPVFGLAEQFVERSERNISRLCEDRCEFLETMLAPDVRQVRLLDVGCSMGYISLFFAKAGASVTGIDSNANQIAFCTALARYHKLPAAFRLAEFDRAFCLNLSEGEYDVVFLFSVLHHVVLKYGVEETRAMMSRLLDVVDVLFVELAQKSEQVSFSWKDALPESDLAIFHAIPDVQIEKVGEFPALNGSVSRPMYAVRRTKKLFNSKVHSPLEVRRSAVKGVNQHDRKYYLGAGVFTKAFIIDTSRPEAWSKFTAEVYAYQRLGTQKYVCRFLGSEIRGNLALISMERLDGSTLMDQISTRKLGNLELAAMQVLAILSAFYRVGLYWNDFRSHNIVVTNGRFIAIDLEHTGPQEREHTLNLFLWLLYDMQCAKSMTHESGIFKANNNKAIPAPPLELTDYAAELRPMVTLALESKDIATFITRQRNGDAGPGAAVEARLGLVNDDPSLSQDCGAIARGLAKEERWSEALDWAMRAICAQPTVAEHHRLQASVLEHLGRVDEARHSIATALKLRPADAATVADQCRIEAAHWDSVREQRNNSSDPALALAAGLTVAQAETSLVADWVAVAHQLATRGRLDEALNWVGRALNVDRGMADVHRLRASLLERLGRLDEARHAITSALEMWSDNSALIADRDRIVSTYWSSIRQERDVNSELPAGLDSGLRLAHSECSSAADWAAVAQQLATRERLHEALAWVGRAVEAEPTVADHRRLQASLLERIGRYKAGYHAAKRALLLQPGSRELAVDAKRMFRKSIASMVGLAGML